jgi:hypothetical protein
MANVVFRLITIVAESSTTRIVIAIQRSSQRWFQRGFQPGSQFDVFRPTRDLRLCRHQHLEVGGVEMSACGQIDFCARRLLQPFEKRFCFFDTRYISKDRLICREFDRH